MNKYSPWVKIPVLVLFFGSIGLFVAFRSGAFNENPGSSVPGSAGPDSPQVKANPDPAIYSTKSGKILVPQEKTADTNKTQKVRMSSSKSMIMVEPQPANPSNNSNAPATDAGSKTKAGTKTRKKPQKANAKASNIEFRDPMPSSKSGPVLPTH